jgi:subtilisin family serine protease
MGCYGQDVTVAVLDTGLANPKGLDRKDFEYLDSEGHTIGPYDPFGHGTRCASLIASYKGGALGIAPHSKIVSYRVLETGTALSDIESALSHIKANRPDVDVISCSFGVSVLSETARLVIRALIQEGRIIVAASGNYANVANEFPEQTPNVITVAPVSKNKTIMQGSRFGDWVDVAAPGEDVPVLLPNPYGTFSGSSAAAAIASGVVALCLSEISDWQKRRKVGLSADGLVKATADQISAPSSDGTGVGIISPKKLYEAIKRF